MYQNDAMKVLTGEVRLSYANLTTPRAAQQGGEPKYSVTLLIPKSDAATKADIDAAIQAAANDALAKVWNGARPPMLKVPIYDGDGVRPSGVPFGDECKGHWVMTASTKNKPQVVGIDNINCELSPADIYSGMYSGVFYDRFIRGLWVVAEGLIYTMFNKDFHVVPSVPRPYEKYVMSCDYGTINPTSIGLWGKAGGKWYRMREYYYDSRKEGRQRTDEEHYTELERLADGLHVSAIIVDPSAASFIEVIRRHDRYRVEKASNSVLDGIRNVATRLQSGDIFFCDCCTDCIREFGMYRWDEKAQMDRPIKENDHSMDDVRYFVHRVYAPDLISFK